MPNIKVSEIDSEMIAKTAAGIEVELYEMQAVWNNLLKQCAEPLDYCWSGPAKDYFDRQLALILSEYVQLVRDFADQNQHLKTIAEMAVMADDAVCQMTAAMFG